MPAFDLTLALETLPASPGVYVFKGARASVLYVGKASSLRSRVRSYFQPSTSDGRAFLARLEDELSGIETFVTQNEKEAALLENQLIKREQPRYNVKLRDDKEFLTLRLDPRRRFPRLEVTRRPKPDGAHYFGPFHSATAARKALRVVNRHFKLRTCTDAELARRTRPCLQYQIKRCPGPCVFPVDEAAYAEQVDHVRLFLSGRHDELEVVLQERMREASQAMRYEVAASVRDQIAALDSGHESQRVTAVRDVDQDVLGLYREADRAEVACLEVRGGRLVRVRTRSLKDVAVPDDELLATVVLETYAEGWELPDEILLPVPIEADAGVAEVLAELRGKKVGLRVPKRAQGARLLDMARENAEHAFREKRRAEEDVTRRLELVRDKLRLPSLPHRIECVDVSHTAGDDTVAVFTALLDASPDRARYRTFHLRDVRGGDDYGAMREVLTRRLARGKAGDAAFSLPDLLVVDGGPAQLRVLGAVASELGVEGLAICALAKEKEDARGKHLVDRVYLPGQKNPIPLASTPALLMLALARDEAHRASNLARTKLAGRRTFTGPLDAIPGVGPRTRARLLAAFGSSEAVAAATLAGLVAAGLTKKQAEAVRTGLRAGGDDEAKAERAAVDQAFESALDDADALALALEDDDATDAV